MYSISQAIARVGSIAAFSWSYEIAAGGRDDRAALQQSLPAALRWALSFVCFRRMLHWSMKRLPGLAGRVQRQMRGSSKVSKKVARIQGDERGEQGESVGTRCVCPRRAILEDMVRSLLTCTLANGWPKVLGRKTRLCIRDLVGSRMMEWANQVRRQACQWTACATWSYLREDEGHSFDVESREECDWNGSCGTVTTVKGKLSAVAPGPRLSAGSCASLFTAPSSLGWESSNVRNKSINQRNNSCAVQAAVIKKRLR